MTGEVWAISLQRAIIRSLKTDDEMPDESSVGGRVYDQPPADPVYPFIRLGKLMVTVNDTGTTLGADFNFTLEVHTRNVGRPAALRIAEDLAVDLHRQEALLQAHLPEPIIMVEVRHMTTEASQEDSHTWVAVVVFTGMLDTRSNYTMPEPPEPEPPEPVIPRDHSADLRLVRLGLNNAWIEFDPRDFDDLPVIDPALMRGGDTNCRIGKIFLTPDAINLRIFRIDNSLAYLTDEAINNSEFRLIDVGFAYFADVYTTAPNYQLGLLTNLVDVPNSGVGYSPLYGQFYQGGLGTTMEFEINWRPRM